MGPSKHSLRKASTLRQSAQAIASVFAILAILVPTTAAQQVIDNSSGTPQSIDFSFSKIFTFLFLTLGPLKLLKPFHSMTRGCSAELRKSLALKSSLIALIAVILASIGGSAILHKWGIAIGSLLLTVGLVLFLVALKPIMEQFAPDKPQAVPEPTADASPPSPMQLAFPTIVTPYGIAILIVLVSLHSDEITFIQILGVTVFILLLDLIAMLFAERILKTPLVAIALGIIGVVMGVLQVALGVSACVLALRLLGFKN
jgi:multiple antibiotic resistance protein